MRLPVAPLLLLLVPCLALAAAPKCTPSTSAFALSEVNTPSCLGTEIANQWGTIFVDQQADCNYTLRGSYAPKKAPVTVSAMPPARLPAAGACGSGPAPGLPLAQQARLRRGAAAPWRAV
jgi:hypothetical protein